MHAPLGDQSPRSDSWQRCSWCSILASHGSNRALASRHMFPTRRLNGDHRQESLPDSVGNLINEIIEELYPAHSAPDLCLARLLYGEVFHGDVF